MERRAARPRGRTVFSISIGLRLVAVLTLLLVTGAAWYEIHTTRQSEIAATGRQMERLGMVFAEQTGQAVQIVDVLALNTAEMADASPRAEPGAVLARRIDGVPQLAGLQLIGQDGVVLAASPGRGASIPPGIVRLLLARYRDDPHAGLLIGEPFSTEPNHWMVLLARPLRDETGQSRGMVAAVLDLNYFADIYRSVQLAEDGAIALHLQDGTLLTRFPDVGAVGAVKADIPLILSAANAATGITAGMAGDERISAIRAVAPYPLVVMVSVGKARVLAKLWPRIRTILVEAIVLGGSVIVLLLILAGRSRRIEQLLDESRADRQLAEQAKDRLLHQIAERERVEVALRQAQRIEAVGQLTGGFAHDFNNLLTVVLGNTEMLLRRADEDGNSRLAERLTAIYAAASRGATLTGQLLAFSRRQPLLPRPTDVNAMIEGMRGLLDAALNAGVQVVFHPGADLWPAMVDQSQIELVVLNLAINALDAMPAGGVVSIETTNTQRVAGDGDGPPPGNYVTITVRDTGTGIAPDILPRVFEPFFTTKPPGSGSGLGLSEVFGTVRQSGGEVRIQTKLGSGTAVSIDLPRAMDPATADAPAMPERHAADAAAQATGAIPQTASV